MIIIIAAVLPWLKLKKTRDKILTRIKEENPDIKLLDLSANCLGFELTGNRFRGVGILYVTDKKISFVKLWPQKETPITLKDVIKVENPTSFMTKTNLRPLLKVVFQDSGKNNAGAWLLSSKDKNACYNWKAEIEKSLPA